MSDKVQPKILETENFKNATRLDVPVLVDYTGMSIKVTVDHMDLGNLIGRLMRMADIMGDVEQRRAVKDTIKREARDWLNDIYDEAGYREVAR